MVKKARVGTQGGGRRGGSSGGRWMDDVELDVRNMGVKRWRRGAFLEQKISVGDTGVRDTQIRT